VTQKLRCVVEAVVAHGEGVYTITLRPERPAPRFRAGQFLHLAIDPYDPGGFWPDSRVFSIASPPASRDALKLTYAVHGPFTTRMEREAIEGHHVWIKMPYGDFVIEDRAEVVLLAGGTGVTAFTAFLENAGSSDVRRITLAYGARTADLLIYRDVVDRCARRTSALSVMYFVEDPASAAPGVLPGRISMDAVWPRITDPRSAHFYISGPPPMLKTIGSDLRARGVAPEAIHIDAWE
jgi:ferredoxin-NADP reductase